VSSVGCGENSMVSSENCTVYAIQRTVYDSSVQHTTAAYSIRQQRTAAYSIRQQRTAYDSSVQHTTAAYLSVELGSMMGGAA
jgi:hypothetical protein